MYTVHVSCLICFLLGGRMILSWSPACTHLVMTAVTITAKVNDTVFLFKPCENL